MQVNMPLTWLPVLQDEFDQPYFQQLVWFIKKEYAQYRVYPSGSKIFRAFELCSFDDLQVVILGQDPYHGYGQANGLCFSVAPSMPVPPSLINIFKEIKNDLNKDLPKDGNLERWAKQGVLLLNAILTVRAGLPGSHQNKGWELFTDMVIQKISQQKNHIVFLLWGAYAQKKQGLIDQNKHLVLKAAHPSPYSADKGFFNTRHFSQANAYLQAHDKPGIDW